MMLVIRIIFGKNVVVYLAHEGHVLVSKDLEQYRLASRTFSDSKHPAAREQLPKVIYRV